jgi:hypothetical protein
MEREGEEQNDWKAWEKAIGSGVLWLLVLAGNEGAYKIEGGFLSKRQQPSLKPTNTAMVNSKFIVAILFVAIAHAAAIGQSSRPMFHANTG